ncbi:MAG: type II secretion system protein [Patescibacteria group bacterium]
MIKRKKGFTLIELLVVIAIIGILAAIGITALSSARAKARDAKRIADLKNIQAALELYFNDKGNYPTGTSLTLGTGSDCNGSACIILCSGETTTGFQNTACTGGTPVTYMGLVPKDPSAAPNASDCASGSNAVCHYAYTAKPDNCDNSTTACTSYELWGYIEGSTGAFTGPAPVCANEKGMKTNTCP